MICHIQPNATPKSRAPFSPVVLDDNYAYLSGLVAADFPEGQTELGDVKKETIAILKIISKILGEVGITLANIVRMDVHLANLDDFDAMDSAYRSFFNQDKYPARTTTESSRLFGDSLVEFTCIARRE